jgi:hypothetical protein
MEMGLAGPCLAKVCAIAVLASWTCTSSSQSVPSCIAFTEAGQPRIACKSDENEINNFEYKMLRGWSTLD